MANEPLLIPIVEAARLVGIGRDNAYALCTRGEWPTVTVGKNRRKVPVAFLRARYAAAFSDTPVPADATAAE